MKGCINSKVATCLFTLKQGLICSLSWPRTHSVAEAGPEISAVPLLCYPFSSLFIRASASAYQAFAGKIRSLKSPFRQQWIQGPPGLHETLSQRQERSSCLVPLPAYCSVLLHSSRHHQSSRQPHSPASGLKQPDIHSSLSFITGALLTGTYIDSITVTECQKD